MSYCQRWRDAHTKKWRTTGSLANQERAAIDWSQPIKIGRKTRPLDKWFSLAPDITLSKLSGRNGYRYFAPSSVGQRRRRAGIGCFGGNGYVAKVQIIEVWQRENKELIHLWATKRPKGMAEYVREITWNRLLEQYGETE